MLTFQEVRIIEEKTYPLEYIISEDATQEIVKSLDMTLEEVKEAANSGKRKSFCRENKLARRAWYFFLSKRQRHLPHLDFQDPPACGRSAIKLVRNLQIALSKNCVYLAQIRFPVLQFGFEPGEFNSEHTFLHFY